MGRSIATLKDVAGFDSRMSVPRNRHSRVYFRFHIYRHITRCRTIGLRQIFRVTPGVVAAGAPCADASVEMNPVSPQIAQDAKPAKPAVSSAYRPPPPFRIAIVRLSITSRVIGQDRPGKRYATESAGRMRTKPAISRIRLGCFG